MSHECAGIQVESGTKLSAPLQHLKDEHPILLGMMDELEDLAEQLKAVGEAHTNLLRLREEVVLFMEELLPHSEKEEGFLFPMLGSYIGKETGPIVVMEYQHEMAKENFEAYLRGTFDLSETITAKEAEKLYNRVIEGCSILISHFHKEENVLFPMAENMLTDVDKAALMKHYKIS
ncbi:Hemerythrin HHE cation binding domain-containing protein [Thalassobacillus cyri]|uniref:Hemerythrin HHE cation binding domain-containing protein n=1 Tax=Thalassobacillus cyri TaxID=571932 RepID=A0A1H4FPQ8_9BACI|nr:hemerythrin domain-containing protein [Thalassobacillus cyri]SEA99131.1 Hemerythrin HHE cation binding domain-containing protein [Thalassobacillus cyri]